MAIQVYNKAAKEPRYVEILLDRCHLGFGSSLHGSFSAAARSQVQKLSGSQPSAMAAVRGPLFWIPGTWRAPEATILDLACDRGILEQKSLRARSTRSLLREKLFAAGTPSSEGVASRKASGSFSRIQEEMRFI